MKVKICGITNPEDALFCEHLGADALGFIFYRKSKRCVTPERVSEMISQLSVFTTTVGVFVNSPAEEINKICRYCGLSVVQLHGHEAPEMATALDRPVIKAFRIHDGFEFTRLDAYQGCHYLLDTYSAESPGGTGHTFNWNVIPAYLRHKIILAGGISIDNISDVHRTISPAAVDLSSALEVHPGKKDKQKVEAFMSRIQELTNEVKR